MSFPLVLDYFSARSKAIGYKEHQDAFNFDNNPDSIIDKTFHIETGTWDGVKLNQTDQEVSCDVTVRLFFKAFRSTIETRRVAAVESEKLVKECLKHSNRLTGASIKNVQLESVNFEPLATSNDNIVVAKHLFSALVILDIT